MKFDINIGVTSIRRGQVEAIKGCMLMAKAIIKQPEVMVLKNPKEWDQRREIKSSLDI